MFGYRVLSKLLIAPNLFASRKIFVSNHTQVSFLDITLKPNLFIFLTQLLSTLSQFNGGYLERPGEKITPLMSSLLWDQVLKGFNSSKSSFNLVSCPWSFRGSFFFNENPQIAGLYFLSFLLLSQEVLA